MRTRIKICGITSLEDAETALDAGADALGFVFYEDSPRYISPAGAEKIISHLGPMLCSVGVFVDENPEKITEIVVGTGLDSVQLHGSESPKVLQMIPVKTIKAFRVSNTFDLSVLDKYQVSAFLLDTYESGKSGGTGRTFDWDIAHEAALHHRIVLAGGLTPLNVAEAIERVKPYAVDVSSGVEKCPGIKDKEKLQEFIHNVRKAGERTIR